MNVIPYAIEAEQIVLGTLLYDNNTYDNIDTILFKDHFYDDLHKTIFETISCSIQQGKIATPITIWPFLMNIELLSKRGGKEYIEQLSRNVMSTTYIKDYAQQIIDTYIRREIIQIARDTIFHAEQADINVESTQYIEDAEQKLFQLLQKTGNVSDIQSFRESSIKVIDSAKTALKSDRKLAGISTGFIDLDKQIGGLHKSDLVTIAGRPSMGKTALAVNIAFNAAKDIAINNSCGGVVFFSLEMSSEQLVTRILGQESKISPDKIRRSIISAQDVEILQKQAEKLANLPLYIDDTPSMGIGTLRARIRRFVRKQSINLVIIDYLQLLTTTKNTENRVQELSFITRSLKAIAKEFDIPVVALSQLSRAVEQREDKRPQLSDLRESGTIEQDSDMVLFIFREAYYESRKKPAEGSTKMQAWQEHMNRIHDVAEIMIAKQRHGPIKNITLHYQDSYAKFGNYIKDVDFIQD